MNRLKSSFRVLSPFLVPCLMGSISCAGQKRAQNPDRGDTAVPQATQRESERQMSEQQTMMEELNMTPAERAASGHQRKMDRRHDRRNEEE